MAIPQEEFEVQEVHLTLLRNTVWEWQDSCFGAPAIDSKRPYGFSAVHQSMGKILGIKEGTTKHTSFTEGPFAGEYPEFTDEQKDYMNAAHSGLMQVLQIGISVGYFAVGKYVKTDPNEDFSWRPKQLYRVAQEQIEVINDCLATLEKLEKNPNLPKGTVSTTGYAKGQLLDLHARLLK